jgi:hypothetical protein
MTQRESHDYMMECLPFQIFHADPAGRDAAGVDRK